MLKLLHNCWVTLLIRTMGMTPSPTSAVLFSSSSSLGGPPLPRARLCNQPETAAMVARDPGEVANVTAAAALGPGLPLRGREVPALTAPPHTQSHSPFSLVFPRACVTAGGRRTSQEAAR